MYYPPELLPTKEQRKKAISLAKDVLVRVIPSKKFEATQGVYVRVKGLSANFENSAQNLFKELAKESEKLENVNCKICAIGSMIVADVIKNNKLTISKMERIGVDSEIGNIQKKIGPLNANCIEGAFEDGVCTVYESALPEKYNSEEWEEKANRIAEKAGYHFKRDPKPKQRLISIFTNVIRNNGVFVPQGVKLRSEHKNITL